MRKGIISAKKIWHSMFGDKIDLEPYESKEVSIIAETETKYKIHFLNEPSLKDDWIPKQLVELIK